MTTPFNETTSEQRQPNALGAAEDWSQAVTRFVNTVQFGSVQIVIQDGRVIQIERTNKIRLDRPQIKDHHGHKPASFRGR